MPRSGRSPTRPRGSRIGPRGRRSSSRACAAVGHRLAETAGRGDHVLGREGDVLGVGAVLGRGRADAQGDTYAAVGVGDGAAAQQAVGVGDVDALLGVEPEDAAVEEGGLVEVVPGLGEGEVVDALDACPCGQLTAVSVKSARQPGSSGWSGRRRRVPCRPVRPRRRVGRPRVRGGGAGPGRGGPRRGGRRPAGSGDSRPIAASAVPSRRRAGPVLTRMRASPCCHRSTGLPWWRAVRVKPRAPSRAETGSASGVTSSAKAMPVGTTGRAGRATPTVSWRTSRERWASTAVGPASACRNTSLKTSSESGPS
jgi:hypothetical protein